MSVLALALDGESFVAGPVTVDIAARTVCRIPIPADAAWRACRDLLLDVAGEDEITAVGICCPGPLDVVAGVVAPASIPQWGHGFALAAAVRRVFPAALVELASDATCASLAHESFGAAPDMTGLAGAGVLALLAEEYADRLPASAHPGGYDSRLGRARTAHRLGGRMSCVHRGR